MPMITCPSCGEDTFTIAGWAAVDHCPYCGRPLAVRKLKLERTLRAKRKLAPRAQRLDRSSRWRRA